LAPKLTSGAVHTFHAASLTPGLGHPAVSALTVTGRLVTEVSGGPGRMIDVVLAVLLGFVVWRRPQPDLRILWLAAAVLASRCFFEPVMTPYYLAPPLFLCLIMASRQSRRRFWAAVIIALEITVFAYHHLNPWVWWLTVVAGLFAVLALGYPDPLANGSDESDTFTEPLVSVKDTVGPAETPAIEQVPLRREPALH
jgi:hypothetical protein